MTSNGKILRFYLNAALNYKHYMLGVILVLPLALLTHQVIPPLIASDILDRLAAGDFQSGDLWGSFGTDIILYSFLMILGGTLVWRIAIYCGWRMETLILRDITRKMFSHLMDLDSNFHSNTFGGSLVSRTNKLAVSYILIANTLIYQVYTLVIMFAVTSVIMWGRSPQYVIALLTASGLYILMAVLSTKNIRKLQNQKARAENQQTGYLSDMITNIMAVKSYSAEPQENKAFGRVTHNTQVTAQNVMSGTLIREMFFGFINTGVQVVALIVATAAVVIYNAEIGNVFLILYFTNNIASRLWDFSIHGLRNLNRGLGEAHEGVETLERVPAVVDTDAPKQLRDVEGRVTLSNIDFSHDHSALFSDFTLDIAPAEKIGLVGPSGGGKTTITKLLLRYMEIQGGQIAIDGQNIADVSQRDLRQHISYVPQEPLLFHRSLAENISYGTDDATQKDIIEAARKAHAHEFIKDLPNGYETLVGERGVKLSGGQRQRVAIARSMIKKAPIVVLDEATSALDSESEKLIQDALWKLMENKTAIVIAHRLSTIQKMDRIVVLDNGKIVEEGTHKQFVKRKTATTLAYGIINLEVSSKMNRIYFAV